MLINPCKTQLPTIPGTRILEDTLGIVGFQYTDPKNPNRVWTLQHLLAPVRKRALGGIRAKFLDHKDFSAYCNQRDLEVLLGIAKPEEYCHWLNDEYKGPKDREWYGLCMDDNDLQDDLYERELRIREHNPGVLPQHIEITRRFHDGGTDVEELLILLWDVDTVTGISPDTQLTTVTHRWARVEKVKVQWQLI